MEREFVASFLSESPLQWVFPASISLARPIGAWGEGAGGSPTPPDSTRWKWGPRVHVRVCRGVPSPVSAEASPNWWSCCTHGPVQSLQGGEASLSLQGPPGILDWWESSFLQEGNERRPRARLARLELGCRPLHSADFVAAPRPICARRPSWVPEGPAYPTCQDLPPPRLPEGPRPSAF